jgi:hypothetical protein
LRFFVAYFERSGSGLAYCQKSTGKKRGLVIELWQAVITSPSGQEESPHGVYNSIRDSLLGQSVFTASAPFSCFPTSSPTCYPCQISVPREAPTPDAPIRGGEVPAWFISYFKLVQKEVLNVSS